MKIPRGTLFLQLSSTTLALVAVALYQHQTAATQANTVRESQRTLYQRYEEVLKLLYANQPMTAAEQLASLPKETVVLETALLRDYSVPYAPEMLFLQLGTMFQRHAARAAGRGEREKAELLLGACRSLQGRLRVGSQDETPLERAKREVLLLRLERVSQLPQGPQESLS